MKSIETISNVERGLANRIAEEARLRMWHMRVVESFVAVSGSYVQENPSFNRFAETTFNSLDNDSTFIRSRPR